MTEGGPLVDLDGDSLLQPLRETIRDPKAELLQWRCERIHVGSVGELYRLEGAARSGAAERGWSLMLKIQRQWARSGDPECWKREALAYRSGFFDTLPETLRVPRCHHIQERDGEIWYWFEEVSGTTAGGFRTKHYCQAARHLGQFHGHYLSGHPLPEYPWLSSRRWMTTTVVNWGTAAVSWLDSREASALPRSLREQAVQLWHRRDTLLDLVDDLPRAVCHRDYNPENLFIPQLPSAESQTIVIDWDCLGIGALAEDLGDLLGEALVFQGVEPDRAPEFTEAVVTAYHAGLVQAGYGVSPETILSALGTLMRLQWCFRLICRYRDTEDSALRERYTRILEFFLNQSDPREQAR